MKPQIFGDVVIQKALDMVEPFKAERAYPNSDLSLLEQHKGWLEPYFYNVNYPLHFYCQ